MALRTYGDQLIAQRTIASATRFSGAIDASGSMVHYRIQAVTIEHADADPNRSDDFDNRPDSPSLLCDASAGSLSSFPDDQHDANDYAYDSLLPKSYPKLSS